MYKNWYFFSILFLPHSPFFPSLLFSPLISFLYFFFYMILRQFGIRAESFPLIKAHRVKYLVVASQNNNTLSNLQPMPFAHYPIPNTITKRNHLRKVQISGRNWFL